MPANSIILTGFSGVGKDTLANLLQAEFPNVANVKFSSLTKQLLAGLLNVKRELLDGNDREFRQEKGLKPWRECPIPGYDVTPLDLLVSLFHGSQATNLHQANIRYTLDNIPSGSFPVFTDIRRMEEYKAVVDAGLKPFVIYVYSPVVDAGKADEFIQDIPADISIKRTDGNTHVTYLKLKQNLLTYGVIQSKCELVLGGGVK